MFEYIAELLPVLMKGTWLTLQLFFIVFILSLPLGWLLSLLRVSRNKIVSKLVELYCWVFRGTPLLLQLLFIYYALPFIGKGITFTGFQCAVIAFVLNYAAYFAEIFRGGIQSIDVGQYEAADVLGMSRTNVMMRIVLPQAFKCVLPSLGNEMITLVKDTALVYGIALHDLLRQAQIAVVRDFRSDAFIAAAIIYLVLTYGATKLLSGVERKFNYYR